MMDSEQANGGANEEVAGQPVQEHAVTLPTEPASVESRREGPQQLDLPADPPFAPEQKNKAAEVAERAAVRAAEKRAAQEEANTFPFAVTVGQVYDGPLDLLLDLIRKQDIDIYDIPIARITGQFLAYVENLKQSDVDSAGEFIYMASLLIHIKSKMLLPRSSDGTTDLADEDPRRELVERQREWAAAHGGGVVEGRDIGSVVFPDAPVKVYLTADDAERALRRSREMLELHYDQVAADIARRDHADSNRPVAPLGVAEDAVALDTTDRPVEAVVDEVLRLVADRS